MNFSRQLFLVIFACVFVGGITIKLAQGQVFQTFSDQYESSPQSTGAIDANFGHDEVPIIKSVALVSGFEAEVCPTSDCGPSLMTKREQRQLERYGEPKIKLNEMWAREVPPGNQGLHFPYNTEKMYYYRRPYNSAHISQAMSVNRNAANGMQHTAQFPRRGQPYSTDVFEMVNRSHAYSNFGSVESRSLEYVDWRKHQQEKANWDAKNVDGLEPADDASGPRALSTPSAPPVPTEQSIYLSNRDDRIESPLPNSPR